MTKAKYTPEERIMVMREKARKQMVTQWEKKRQETGRPLGYFGGHRRVRTQRGPVKLLKCDTCGKQAQHWAHVHDTSYDNPENYRPMCQKCHWVYDSVASKTNAPHTLATRSEAAKRMWKRRKQNASSASLVVDTISHRNN